MAIGSGCLTSVKQVSLGLFVGVWVARYLGPTQFGLLNYAIALVSLFASGTAIGLGTLVVRDIARDPECKEEALGTAFIVQLVRGIITLLLSVTAIAVLNPDDSLTWSFRRAAVNLHLDSI